MTEKEELSFYSKLTQLIAELKAPKGQYNKFGKYNYRSAEDIVEVIKPLAGKYGLLPNLTDELIMVGDRYYVKATASITDGDTTKESVGYARESESKKGMDESQITGTASSYARKYALNGLYLIDDTKDADTEAFVNEQEQLVANNTNGDIKKTSINAMQLEIMGGKVTEFAKQQGGNVNEVYPKLAKHLGVNPNAREITSDEFGIVMNYLNQALNFNGKPQQPKQKTDQPLAWERGVNQ